MCTIKVPNESIRYMESHYHAARFNSDNRLFEENNVLGFIKVELFI